MVQNSFRVGLHAPVNSAPSLTWMFTSSVIPLRLPQKLPNAGSAAGSSLNAMMFSEASDMIGIDVSSMVTGFCRHRPRARTSMAPAARASLGTGTLPKSLAFPSRPDRQPPPSWLPRKMQSQVSMRAAAGACCRASWAGRAGAWRPFWLSHCGAVVQRGVTSGRNND
jgi:hypothetical protein